MLKNDEIAQIAENSDEKFWLERKEETLKSLEVGKRNVKINNVMLVLCEDELKKFSSA